MAKAQHGKKKTGKTKAFMTSRGSGAEADGAFEDTAFDTAAVTPSHVAAGSSSHGTPADATQTMQPTYRSITPMASAREDGTVGQGYAESSTGSSDYSNMIQNGGKKKGHRGLIIALSIVAGVLVAAYIGMSIFFMAHFGFNTTIDNVDCSFKTVDQVESILAEQMDDYSLAIMERGGATETIKGSAIDLEYVSDGQVADLLSSQQPFAWIARLFSKDANETLVASVEYNQSKLTDAVGKLSCMKSESMKAPVDAYPEYNGTEYVIHPEDVGTTIDTSVIYSVIDGAVASAASSVDLDASGCYTAPALTSTSEKLQQTVDTYNKYVNFSITYTFGDAGNEVLDGQAALSFLDIADDGSASIDEDAVASWVAGLAERHDTVGSERTYTSPSGAQVTISGGTYGWEIDQDAEKSAIIDLLNGDSDEKNQTRDPAYIQEAASHGATDWGSSYIDLDLTGQHMYLVVDGSVTFESDVVTGLPTPQKETPSGVYDILDMQSPYTMHGDTDPATGEPSYVTTCSYFMRMTWTGVAFHDASWQSSFGGTRYQTNGSHGCINMPPDAAAELYGLIWVGLPVISHY